MKFCVPLLLTLLPVIAAAAEDLEVEAPRMRFGAFTIYTENDKYFAGTDRHYTNGFKLSALSRDLTPELAEAPAWARTIVGWLPTHGVARPGRKLGFALGQNIYTPEDIETTELVPDDRPYAAWLYASLAVHTQTATRLDVFEVSAGVVGPSALGRDTQNGWHHIIGVDEAAGWRNQLRDEPGLIMAYEHRRRIPIAADDSGWGAEFIPHAGASLGNVDTHLSTGGQVRFGWRLPSDFGNALIRPGGDSNTHDPRDLKGWSVHAFAGVDGKLVAQNIFLDGNTFRSSHSVNRREFVADLMGGASLRLGRFRASYAQVYRTKEFVGQDRADVFGSIALTILY